MHIDAPALPDVGIHILHLLPGGGQGGAVQLVDLGVGMENFVVGNAQHHCHVLPGGKAGQADDTAQAFRLKILGVEFAVHHYVDGQLLLGAGDGHVGRPGEGRGKVHLHGAFVGHAKGRLHADQRGVRAACQALQHGVLHGKGIVGQCIHVHGQGILPGQVGQREGRVILI